MNISSTEFQQNVGYFLGLAEKGKEINIKRSKPTEAYFILKQKKVHLVNDKPRDEFIKDLEKYSFRSGKKGPNGLNFQKSVRS